MKKIYLCLLAGSFFAGHAQTQTYGKNAAYASNNTTPHTSNSVLESCNTVVVNDTEEENGVFISGMSGQKAAVDIPIAGDTQITITGVKVTLASVLPPNFVSLRFYENILSVPEDPEVTPGFIPGAILFNAETGMDSFEEIGYEPLHQFTIRRITLTLPEPIVLSGNAVNGRYWMGVLSDANAWGTTAHFDTGEGVVGESVAMGSNNSEWFQLLGIEGQYELTAECALLGVPQFDTSQIAVFPNPAVHLLNVSLASGKAVNKAEIFNISGQKVKEVYANFDHIDVSSLSGGVYILKTDTTDGLIFNTKFVKLN